MALLLPSLGLQYAEQLPPVIRQELEQLIASLQLWMVSLESGSQWIDVPYEASLFSVDSGTWTVARGNYLLYRYRVQAGLLHAAFYFQNTTTTGVGNELRLRLPPEYRLEAYFTGLLMASGTVAEHGIVIPREDRVDSKQLSLQRLSPSTSWGTGTQSVRGFLVAQASRV